MNNIQKIITSQKARTNKIFQFYAFLRKNNTVIHKLFVYPYGHKHFSPWFSLPNSCFDGPEEFYNFKNNEDCLIIVVFRNPYDWVRSFYNQPWHASPQLKFSSFKKFIRLPWEVDRRCPDSDLKQQLSFNVLLDKKPDNGNSFRNIFELRSYKIENMIMIKDKVKNIYYVNYEAVRDNSEGFIEEIHHLYNLERKSLFRPVIQYKGDQIQGIYKPKRYPKFSQQDLEYINSQLDEELEKSIGYEILK